MTSHQLLAEWSQWFWPVFANHLWQATLFALVAWIAAISLNQAPARTRRLVWLMAFAKFILPSAALVLLARELGLNLLWPSRTGMIAVSGAGVLLQVAEPVEQTAQPSAGASHNEVYCVLTMLWLAGVALFSARWRMRRRRLATVLLAGERIENGREAAMLEGLKSRLNVRRRVGLVVSSQIAEPVVWRALRPIIVLPRGLAEKLSDDELESVLTHELFHVKRFDNLFGPLQMFVCCLLWFHPLVWLIDRRLIEERELTCDEQVVLSGAAPEAYAASLWKVVQFGFGWPVEGVSRATGANLKRRIKFMLNANHQLKSSAASRALAGIAIIALVAIFAAMALFSRDGAAVAKAQNDQDRNFVATAPMRFENLPEIPLVITEARLSAGEARLMTSGGVDSDRKASHIALRGGMARDVEFAVNVVNQGSRPISEFMIEIQNAPFWTNRHFNTRSMLASKSDGQGVIGPQESFAFKARFPLQEKEDDKDLMSHLYDFNVRVTGVRFDSEEYWLMARPGETPNTARVKMSFNFPANAATREMRMRKKDSAGEQDQRATESIYQMDSSTRPTILYREKAEYTQEARDENVEGSVVLSVVFGADSQISGIKVIRALPAGLTEKTIEAAKKIRFKPAMKDGQPVSVRVTLEFHFRLGQ